MKDCGRDAHEHIKGSVECGPDFFDMPRVERANRARFLARLVAEVARLAGEPSGKELQRAVVAELGKADLPALGITEAEVLAGAGVKEGEKGQPK